MTENLSKHLRACAGANDIPVRISDLMVEAADALDIKDHALMTIAANIDGDNRKHPDPVWVLDVTYRYVQRAIKAGR